ncbi:MAG TPA: 6-phosphogluconolactonase [Thermoanaerobaculia bacterium]|nr:6-phosphogluconolactonase [Thermoanaerobaculia bacterium]
MLVEIVADADAVARRAADSLVRALARSSALRLALPTGRTAAPLYEELARRRRAGRFDLGETRVFNLDELLLPVSSIGTPPAGSFAEFMHRHVVSPLGMRLEHWEIPRAGAEDPEAECLRYDRVLAEGGPLDLAVLGIGADGHVAYNLPNEVSERTHVVEVPEAAADTLELPASARPLRAITMGLGPLRSARRLLLLASGEEKAEAVRALVQGREDPEWPASLLKRHPRFEILIDRAAAAGLR